jgi:hypothetical protein
MREEEKTKLQYIINDKDYNLNAIKNILEDYNEQKINKSEIMSDFDEDKYVKAYCIRQNCHSCDGTDFNGEPNGYGCPGLEERICKMYHSIYKRRLNKRNKIK